jgi:hypothetical protein
MATRGALSPPGLDQPRRKALTPLPCIAISMESTILFACATALASVLKSCKCTPAEAAQPYPEAQAERLGTAPELGEGAKAPVSADCAGGLTVKCRASKRRCVASTRDAKSDTTNKSVSKCSLLMSLLLPTATSGNSAHHLRLLRQVPSDGSLRCRIGYRLQNRTLALLPSW